MIEIVSDIYKEIQVFLRCNIFIIKPKFWISYRGKVNLGVIRLIQMRFFGKEIVKTGRKLTYYCLTEPFVPVLVKFRF